MNNEHDEDKIIILTDESGEDVEFEVIADFKLNEIEYCVLFPVDGDEEEALLFKIVEEENGEAILEIIEDDDEFAEVAKYYEEIMAENN